MKMNGTSEQPFEIPELPSGRVLRLELLTNWSDTNYVGLNAVEVYSKTGKREVIEKVECSSPEAMGDINAILRVHLNYKDSCHLWKCKKGIEPISISLLLVEETQIAMIRIWNYNESRVHAQIGVRDLRIFLDETPIFQGEINPAFTEAEFAPMGDTVLFTTDETILESIAENDVCLVPQLSVVEDSTNSETNIGSMSLSDISLASLQIILESMRKDPRNVDSLRKTSKLFNQQAVELGLHKLDGAFIRLAIESRKFRYNDDKMGKDCVIRATIKMRKPAEDPDCFACYRDKGFLRSCYEHDSDSDSPDIPFGDIYEDATDSEGSGMEDTYRLESNRRRRSSPDIQFDEGSSGSESESDVEAASETDEESDFSETDSVCSCKAWFIVAKECWTITRRKKFKEIFSRLLKRVNSISKLKIKCYRINDDEMTFLNQQPQLRNLRKLVLFNCHLHVEKENFHGFLRSQQLREVILSCKYTKYRLENEFLFNMNRVQLYGVYGKKQRFFDGLTDELLAMWRDRPPTYCSMQGFDTTFTIVGIIRLMRTLQETLYNFKYVLSMVPMTIEGYRKLLKFAQRKRNLTWSFVTKRMDKKMFATAVFPNGSNVVLELQMQNERALFAEEIQE